MSRIECVIFDWAGTTVDFGSLSPVSAFREAFRSFCVLNTTIVKGGRLASGFRSSLPLTSTDFTLMKTDDLSV